MSTASSNLTQTAAGRQSWAERLANAAERFDDLLPDLRARRTVFVVDTPEVALEAVGYAYAHGLDFGVLEASRLSVAVEQRLEELAIARLDTRTGSLAGARCGTPTACRISVMTSGTTGVLKAVAHSWRSLNTLDRVRSTEPRTWFVPYQPGSYAWYQMVCLSLFQPEQHLFCANSADPVASFRDALRHGIDAVTSTPTFWRCAFMAIEPSELEAAPIESITLGGEIVDQAILDQLRTTYPEAAIRHIFASSEAGAAIVVTDGRAGFPVSRLEKQDGIGVRVENGRLFVRSSYTTAAADGDAEAWVDTGDLVEVRGDRVYFLGRDGASLINVGGMKAFPAEIEAQLMRHPNVLWAQVRERRAPLVGSLPAASVVLRSASDQEHDEAELSAFARECLPEHAVPRSWRFLAEIPMEASLKTGGVRNADT